MRRCRVCNIEKPATIDHFYLDRGHLQTICKPCFNAARKARYLANKDQERRRQKEYYAENKDYLAITYKSYAERNKDRKTAYQAEYRMRHKNKAKEYAREYMRQRRSKDIEFKIKDCLRSRLNKVIKFGYKSVATIELIGCSVHELMQHLENRFSNGMTWENYGSYWHIDHVRPCASFDLKDQEQQKQCFHYSNLQPLKAIENIRKGAKWDGRGCI